MGRSLPSERPADSSPALPNHATLPNLAASTAIPDRHSKTSTAPPTGSPTLAPRNSYRHRPEDDILVQTTTQGGYPEARSATLCPIAPPSSSPPQRQAPSKSIPDLPIEIQEAIINHLAGVLGLPKTNHNSRNWSSAMRHPRRRMLSDLALVCKTWRPLIQERLYRHLKIKGTRTELQICGDWFLTHPHFQSYVRHVEIWVPLFEVMTGPRPRAIVRIPPDSPIREDYPTNPRSQAEELVPTRRMFQNTDNASLEEIFGCTKVLFPEACALTIEGGHCKKSRKIQHFRLAKDGFLPMPSSPGVDKSGFFDRTRTRHRHFPEHMKISTLILKGSWNIVRQSSDFHNLTGPLPNLREWHCVYAKPKTDAYKAMCSVLRHFPPTISRINICLEGLNGKQPSSLAKWRKLYPEYHICKDLGRLMPQLEALTFTGHVCGSLFKHAVAANTSLRDAPRLKSVDLFVRNCCREPSELEEGPSIHNWPFIQAFASLVAEAVTALKTYPYLNYLRIRFLDLDTPRPLLNPYFHLENNVCTGMWDKKILAGLQDARPDAKFEVSCVEDEGILDWLDGPTYARPKSMNASSYAALAQGGGPV